MASYAEAYSLLQQLQLLGLTDSAYRVLRPQDSITRQLALCAQYGNVVADHETENLHRRLLLARDAYVKAGFRSGREEVWKALVTAVKAEIPT